MRIATAPSSNQLFEITWLFTPHDVLARKDQQLLSEKLLQLLTFRPESLLDIFLAQMQARVPC